MQVSSILNTLFGAGSSASPLGSNPSAENNGFFTTEAQFGDVALNGDGTLPEAVAGLLGLNNPAGGIVPLPQSSDTVNPLTQQVASTNKDYILSALGSGEQPANLMLEGDKPASLTGLLGKSADVLPGSAQNAGTQTSGIQAVNPELGKLVANEVETVKVADAGSPNNVWEKISQQHKAHLDGTLQAEKKDNIATGLTPVSEGEQLSPEVQKLVDSAKKSSLDGDNLLNARIEAIAEKDAKAQARTEANKAVLDQPNSSLGNLATLIKSNNSQYAEGLFSRPTDQAIDANEEFFASNIKEFNAQKSENPLKFTQEVAQNSGRAVDQVKIKISQAIYDGSDKISIKLEPAALGKVDVDIDVMDDGKTQIRIVADKAETLEMLKRDAGELERGLREVGMRADRENLEFSLRGDSSNDQQHAGNSGGSDSQTEEQSITDERYNYSKYHGMKNSDLVLNIEEYGLDIVA